MNKSLVGSRFPFLGSGGEPTEVVGLDQKLEQQKNRSQKMSREQSDGEDSVVGTGDGPVDDGTVETEMNFRLPRGSDPGPDRVQRDIPIVTGAVGTEAVTPAPGQTRQLGAKPKRPKYELPIWPTPGPGRLVPRAGIQPVTDRFAFKVPTPTYPGPGRQLPGTGTQPVTDRFAYEPESIYTP